MGHQKPGDEPIVLSDYERRQFESIERSLADAPGQYGQDAGTWRLPWPWVIGAGLGGTLIGLVAGNGLLLVMCPLITLYAYLNHRAAE